MRLLDVQSRAALTALLERFGLQLVMLDADGPIPGSYWGAPEAGLVDECLYVQPSTPLHSALHEAGHWICMDAERRQGLHTDAGGDDLEECAVCYLQMILAEEISGYGRARICADMDAWGYSFRLGGADAWFREDAADARGWLIGRGILDANGALARIAPLYVERVA
jgi:hypothetical protein